MARSPWEERERSSPEREHVNGLVSISKLELFTIIDGVVPVPIAGSDIKEMVVDSGHGDGDIPIFIEGLAVIIAEDAEDEKTGEETGPEDERTGPEDEGTGPEDEETGPEDEGTGPEDEETGSEDEETGPEDEGMGPEDEGTGPEDEGTGTGADDYRSVNISRTVQFR